MKRVSFSDAASEIRKSDPNVPLQEHERAVLEDVTHAQGTTADKEQQLGEVNLESEKKPGAADENPKP